MGERTRLERSLESLTGVPYAPKAQGPVVHAIGRMDPALVAVALHELGDPRAWPPSPRA